MIQEPIFSKNVQNVIPLDGGSIKNIFHESKNKLFNLAANFAKIIFFHSCRSVYNRGCSVYISHVTLLLARQSFTLISGILELPDCLFFEKNKEEES